MSIDYDPWAESHEPKRFERTDPQSEGQIWLAKAMQKINELTPNINGKAFDPDWFLLREHFQFASEKIDGVADRWWKEKIAFAEGRDVEYKLNGDDRWHAVQHGCIVWSAAEYRIKPKHVVEKYIMTAFGLICSIRTEKNKSSNLKVTFDADTGEPLSCELIKAEEEGKK